MSGKAAKVMLTEEQQSILRWSQIDLRKDPSQLKLRRPIGIAAVTLGLVFGQNLDRRRMPQVWLQADFLQKIGDPRPAERRLQGDGSAGRDPAEPLPHRLTVVMLQASPLGDMNLAFGGHLL